MTLRQRYRSWKFGRALDRFQRSLPPEWKALTEEQQADEINRIIKKYRAERRAIALSDSAGVTATESRL